mgnify:CR=1 FL=1
MPQYASLGALQPQMVHSAVRSILAGVHLLHQAGVAHCDIKAANILLREEAADAGDAGDNIVLADFNGCTTAGS